MQYLSRSTLALALVLAGCTEGSSITGAASTESMMADLRANDFTVLAEAAVTCTDGTIVGDVGTNQAAPTGSFTQTTCPVTGSIHVGDGAARAAFELFRATYANLALSAGDSCTLLTGTLAGVTLAPGTYCFDAAAALTGTLTLDGPANGEWLFQVGTSGTGALTGTNFTVVLANGADACNVTWWVAEAATLTTSQFVGSILAGAAITLTGGSYSGNAWSLADVTITGTQVDGCTTSGGSGMGGGAGSRCNQGVGNGPEGCDPGNSNRRRPTNDEQGGILGAPGRNIDR